LAAAVLVVLALRLMEALAATEVMQHLALLLQQVAEGAVFI
jgi:hypothetical protein